MKLHRLTPLEVTNITKPGRHADGGGLVLQVKGDAKSWIFRYRRGGGEREMGLGSVAAFTLAEARNRAKVARQQLADGLDPIEERRKALEAAKLEAARAITFEEAADRYIKTHRAGWKNEKHAEQWANTLSTYAFPVLGSLPVAGIETSLVTQVLEPIWLTKSETASRVRGRIERILDWARVQGMRQGENPARWRGHLDKLLPARSKVRAVRHQPALPWQQIPAFMGELRQRTDISSRALEFTCLTCARTGETIGATWPEIDLDGKLWIVPAERMKGGLEHRVPLSDRAVEILKGLPRERGNDHAFIGAVKGQGLSNMSMLELMRGMGLKDANGEVCVPHGLRSTFRDWAGESTGFPHDILEACLAHKRKDRTHASYQRGDLLQKRRKVMESWASYCAKSATVGKLLTFKKV
jgi:integrase